MSKQKFNSFSSLVYSTNKEVKIGEEEEVQETLPKEKQKLRIRLETKHRGGKAVTVVAGFIGNDEDMEALSKQLKNHCGTGGSAKDGEILVQGDQKEKVKTFLLKQGYKDTK
jgi:translation initiation factor 1